MLYEHFEQMDSETKSKVLDNIIKICKVKNIDYYRLGQLIENYLMLGTLGEIVSLEDEISEIEE